MDRVSWRELFEPMLVKCPHGYDACDQLMRGECRECQEDRIAAKVVEALRRDDEPTSAPISSADQTRV